MTSIINKLKILFGIKKKIMIECPKCTSSDIITDGKYCVCRYCDNQFLLSSVRPKTSKKLT